VKIVFFGTPDFAATSLKKIYEAGFDIVGVITAPDKPAGRGQKIQRSAVKITAESLGLPVYQPRNLKSEECQHKLQSWDPDLGVVIAFRMLPESVWNFPPLGTINLHASLLPNYRGAAPIQHVLINGEKQTGVTTFFLKHEIDTGDIIDRESITLSESMNAGELHDILMNLGALLMIKSLQKINVHGKETPTIAQPKGAVDLHLAPKLSREFCELIDLKDVNQVYNKIRGLSPYPGAWIQCEWGVMKILCAKIENIQKNLNTGVILENKKLYLLAENGSLMLEKIQLPGKREMSVQDFINGITGILKKK
jgi:methionyl-tRNA formyltransferase